MSDKYMSKRCGYAAIVGRPNVGKSTLLNTILGQKISITSRKPQTTRHQILGIHTVGKAQTIYVDTPGLHANSKQALNRYMNRAASAVLEDVSAIVFVVDSLLWTEGDEFVLEKLAKSNVPIIVAVNKVDKITDKNKLLPHLKSLAEKLPNFHDIIPISAKTGANVTELQTRVAQLLPEAEQFIFSEDEITANNERLLAAEIIREKIMRSLGQELPYSTAVELETFNMVGEILHVYASIWVERSGQKAIIIGKKGEMLKKIGTQARLDLEKLFEQKVFLQLWVKIRSGWSDDERALRSLGYE
ncbi:MAG: GTPase Era [Gammaproteobacteria bacterium]|nr:GTPase Era [Gammaproteobacteria bacterium]